MLEIPEHQTNRKITFYFPFTTPFYLFNYLISLYLFTTPFYLYTFLFI